MKSQTPLLTLRLPRRPRLHCFPGAGRHGDHAHSRTRDAEGGAAGAAAPGGHRDLVMEETCGGFLKWGWVKTLSPW